MAESVVSFFLQNLGNLSIEEGRFLRGVEGQIKSLQDELEWVRSLLRDADKKRLKFERVKAYVSQIRDVAYDAEDAIEMFLLNVELQRMRSIGVFGSVRSLVGCISQLPSVHELGNQIVEIKTRLKEISENKSKYGRIDDLEVVEYSGFSNEAVSRRESRAPIVDVADVVGFKKEEEKLAKQLLDQGDQQLNIISIVGMGGLGKTTLAKKVYNRSDIKNHFDTCAWITVSQEFRIIYLLERTIKQVMVISDEERKKLGEKSEEELRSMLNQHFQGKNYLIVFDDVWRKEDWDRLKEAFLVTPTTGRQGRVLLTTRKEDVAKHANPLSNDLLKPCFLDENESLELFVKVVF